MPPEDADAGRLWHVVEAAELVARFVAGRSESDLVTDLMLRSAVERQVGIIGEAVSKLSKTLRDANPHGPWGQVVGTRHRPVHEYDRVGLDVPWRIPAEHVPKLLEQVRPLIPPPPADPLPEP